MEEGGWYENIPSGNPVQRSIFKETFQDSVVPFYLIIHSREAAAAVSGGDIFSPNLLYNYNARELELL
jgi:hypothetical protein